MNQPESAPEKNQSAGASTPPAAVGPLSQVPPQNPQALPEQDLWSGRMHWQNAIGRVLFWVILNVAMIVAAYYVPHNGWLTTPRLIWGLTGFFVLSTIFILGGVLVRILQTHYRITSQRLFIEKGVLSRTMDQTELIRVDDVRMEQTFINRIFNVGTVLMLTTDVTDRAVPIVGIKDPVRVTEIIRQQIRALRARTVYVENVTSRV